MNDENENLVSGLVGSIFTILLIISIILFVISIITYWAILGTSKIRIERAMTDIQANMHIHGVIDETYVQSMMDKYCGTTTAYKGYTVDKVVPAFNVKPQYLGQPMYIELIANFEYLGIKIPIHCKADIGNSGHYGLGYNTKSSVED